MIRCSAHALTWLGWLLTAASLLLPMTGAIRASGMPPGTAAAGWKVLATTAGITFNPFIWFLMPNLLVLSLIGLATVLVLVGTPLLAWADDRAGLVQIPAAAVPLLLLLLPPHVRHCWHWGVIVWIAGLAVFSLGGLLRCLAPQSSSGG
jgi:hypothetical protein